MFNESELISSSVAKLQGEVSSRGFIYFLIRDEKIVYVGQTRNLNNRLSQHKGKYVYLIGGEPAVERWISDYELGVVK